MEAFFIVLVIAIIVEALIQVVKAWVPEGASVPAWLWPVCSAVLGVLLCVLAGVDALALLGVTLAVPAVGSVLTGVLVSRGASFVHDLWNKIKGESVVQVEAPVDVHFDGMTIVEDEKPPDGTA